MPSPFTSRLVRKPESICGLRLPQASPFSVISLRTSGGSSSDCAHVGVPSAMNERLSITERQAREARCRSAWVRGLRRPVGIGHRPSDGTGSKLGFDIHREPDAEPASSPADQHLAEHGWRYEKDLLV